MFATMAGANEVPATGLRHLGRRGGRTLVYHAGTGEVKLVEDSNGDVVLKFSAAGAAYLEYPTGRRVPTAEILQKALCQAIWG